MFQLLGGRINEKHALEPLLQRLVQACHDAEARPHHGEAGSGHRRRHDDGWRPRVLEKTGCWVRPLDPCHDDAKSLGGSNPDPVMVEVVKKLHR